MYHLSPQTKLGFVTATRGKKKTSHWNLNEIIVTSYLCHGIVMPYNGIVR